MNNTLLTTIVAVPLCALGLAAPVNAAPTVFYPDRYAQVTPADRSFLRFVDGWARRMNGRDRALTACKTVACQYDRARMLGDTGLNGAITVRTALKLGVRPRYVAPVTPCVRRAGSLFAHSANSAWRWASAIESARYGVGGWAAVRSSGKRYVAHTRAAISAAKACQQATKKGPRSGY